jgi:hypothetical protein
MVTWGGLREVRPDLAEAGRARFYQFGVGLAFLATVATTAALDFTRCVLSSTAASCTGC